MLSPFAFYIGHSSIFLLFLLIWGIAVIADSPMFSTLVAQHADSEIKGTALTVVNCIGFSVTIVSIQAIGTLIPLGTWAYGLLTLGPIFGMKFISNRMIE